MKTLVSGAALLLVAALAPSSGASPGSANASPAVHRIVIEKMAFGPAPAGVHAGDIIEWINKDIFRHSVTASDKSFDLDIAPDAVARVTVLRAGNFLTAANTIRA